MNEDIEIYIHKAGLHQIQTNMTKDLEFAEKVDFNRIDHNMYVTILTLRGLSAYLKSLRIKANFQIDTEEFERIGTESSETPNPNRGEL